MGRTCAVDSCVNSKKGTKQGKWTELVFHTFPHKNPDLCQIWVSKCGNRGGEKSRKSRVPNVSNSKICSDHFQASDYIRDLEHELLNLPPRRRLKPDAVPSLLLGDSSSSMLPDSDISSSSAAEPERFKSHCFFCGLELTYEEKAGPGKQSTMYSQWAQSCASSVCKLFGLEGWFKNVFRSASYCDPCLELVREVDFSMKMLDKVQGQVDSCRKKSEKLLRRNYRALTIKQEVNVEEDGDQVPSLDADPYEKAVTSVVEGLDKKARESEVDPSIVPVIVNISSRAPAPSSSSSVACQTEALEILSNVPTNFIHLISLPVPPKTNSSAPPTLFNFPVSLYKANANSVVGLPVPGACPKGKKPTEKKKHIRKAAYVTETVGDIQELDFASDPEPDFTCDPEPNLTCDPEPGLTRDPEQRFSKKFSKRTLRKSSPNKRAKKRPTEAPAKVNTMAKIAKKNLTSDKGMPDNGDFDAEDSIPHAETVTKPKPKRIRKRTKPRKGFGCTYLSCKNSTFFTENNLQNHIRLKHLQEPNPFHCHSCDEKFDFYEVYRDHVTANHMVPIKCSEPGCGHLCYSESIIKMHMRRVHGIQVPLARKNRYVPRPAPAHRSGRRGSPANANMCEVCYKIFSKEEMQELENHMKLHEAKKEEGTPLSCVIIGCMASFSYSAALRKHVKAEHENRSFKHQCRTRPFYRLSSIWTSKTKGPAHLCSICGKSFNFPHLFRDHMRTHTGERPFKCPYKDCGASFINSWGLRNHEQYHSDERPFLCFKCAWAFKTPSNLQTHLANHKEREERRAKGESIRLDPQSGPRSRRKPKRNTVESHESKVLDNVGV